MRKWLTLLYVTEAAARRAGLTHEGTLFGVPAWFGDVSDDSLVAAPKIPILQLWCMLADFLYQSATYFMSEDQYLEAPIRIGRKL